MAGAQKLKRPPWEYVQHETLANANVRLTWSLFNCFENRPTPDLLHSPILGSNLMSRPQRTPSNNCTTVCDYPCDHLHRRCMCIMCACICMCGVCRAVCVSCVRACLLVCLFAVPHKRQRLDKESSAGSFNPLLPFSPFLISFVQWPRQPLRAVHRSSTISLRQQVWTCQVHPQWAMILQLRYSASCGDES
jgi:hypothetical protein